jgi:UDP-2,4-diacetamido-2,4,6-trideoxy-beta-L-altropyranose hydrolase
MARVVFRCDASPSIGSGHIMRCMALASIFANTGWQVAFAVAGETVSSVAALRQSAIERVVLDDGAESEPGELARHWPAGADLLVVDHYGRDAVFERACRPWAKRIAVIDDLADRPHDADLLVDAGALSPDAYRSRVAESCEVLTGPQFAIVAPAFARARTAALARRDGRPVERVLVSFGQIDPGNVTAQALAALQAVEFDGEIDVVIGHTAQHLVQLRAQVERGVHLHVDAANMPELMSAADLAIGAGGVTAWERCCLGLPSILMAVAENQRGIVSRVASAGAGIDASPAAGVTESRTASALRRLLADGTQRAAMARAAAALVDGRGCDRVLARLVKLHGIDHDGS